MVAKKSAKKSVSKKRKVVAKKAAPKKTVRTAKKPVRKVAKKAAPKKAAPKKAAPKKAAPKKIQTAKKMFTKSEIQRVIAEHTGLAKKEVADVFAVLKEIVHNHIKPGAVGSIKLEGLLKIDRIRKPAKPARKGINPFTGEEMMFKAKPAHSVIKARALKSLKEMVK